MKYKDIPEKELCPICKQPDSCGDCNHKPLPLAEWKILCPGDFDHES